MSNAAKAHEPSMEEILASIRRIIADDEPAAETAAEAKPASAKAAKPAPAPEPAPKPQPAADAGGELGQDDIDAMLASFDAPEVPGKEPEPEPEADEDDDVLDLKKPAAKSAEVDFVEKAAEPDEDLSGWGVEAEDEPSPPPRSIAPMSVPEAAAISRQVGDTLLGQESGAAVASAFSSLAHTILQQNARTLDDLVEEMLRPMLKGWLDDNLPGIVERLVRAEIERVSRGPRR